MSNWRKDKRGTEIVPPQISDGETVAKPSKSEAKTPSWKSKRPSANTGADNKYWTSGVKKRSRFRELSLLVLMLGIVVIGAVLSVMIWRQDRSTPCLIVAGLEYDAPWMPNAWLKEDIARFESLFDGSAREQSLACLARSSPENGDWDEILKQQLKTLSPGGPGGSILPFRKYKSIVIYLSAHGVVRSNQPRLVFGKKEVPFEDVLRFIDEEDRLKGIRTLLVIDSGKQLPDMRLALFENQFFSRAEAVVKSQTRPYLAVLFSASDHEIAWTAPELSGTIFGATLARGFLGAADEDRNRRITALELERFVGLEVGDYSKRTRRAKQTPKLVWSQDKPQDFEISYCKEDRQGSRLDDLRATPASLKPAGLDELVETWKAFEAWRLKLLQRDPWRVASVRASLSRADQLIWAGAQYNATAQSLTMKVREQLKSDIARSADLPGSFRRFSNTAKLADASKSPAADVPNSGSPDGAANDSQDPAADASNVAKQPPPDNVPTAPDTSFSAVAKAFLDNPRDAEGKPKAVPKAKDIDEFIAFAWPWLEQPVISHWSREGLANLFQLLPDDRGNSASVRAPDAFLLALGEDFSTVERDWIRSEELTGPSASLLVSLRESYSNLYPRIEAEPRILSQMQTAMDRFEFEIRADRDALHARTVFEPLKPTEITSLEKQLEAETQKLRLADLIQDEVVPLVNWSVSNDVSSETSRLIDQLSGLESTSEMTAEEVRKTRDTLIARYVDEVHSIANAKALEPASFQRLQLHLSHLPVNAEERELLHGKLVEHLVTLASTEAPTGNPSSEQSPIRFESLTIDGSIVSRLVNDGDSGTDSKEAGELPERCARFLTQSRESRGWRLKPDQKIDQLRANANKVRLFANLLPDQYDTADLDFDAARELEVQSWHDYLLWRAESFLQDFWVYPLRSIRSETPYFQLCAAAHLSEAKRLARVPRPRVDEMEGRLLAYSKLSNDWSGLLNRGEYHQDDAKRSFQFLWDAKAYPKGEARVALEYSELGENRLTIADGVIVGEFDSPWTNTRTDLPEELSALADYRGHRAERRIIFARTEPIWVLQNDVPNIRDAIIRIDTPLQPVEIVFALDCSNSFTADGFRKATAAVSAALEQFKERSNVKVALVAFGHSRTFPGLLEASQKQLSSNAEGENIPWTAKYPSKSGNRFDDDAVVLESLAAASQEHVRAIESYFADLRPFGATPLYYAIEKSKLLLDASYKADPERDVLRRVVVITDGVNDVTARNKEGKAVTDPAYQIKTNRTIADVNRVFQTGCVAQIDVILIDVKKETNDVELRDLTEKYSGKYRVSDFEKIAEDLSNALNPRRVSIVHPGEIRSGDIVAKKFGEFRVGDLPADGTPDPRNLIVSSDGKEMSRIGLGLLGGDRVKIEFDAQRKLFKFPFRRPNSISRSLGQGLLVWRVPPRSDARDVRFVLDREKSDDQTLRPTQVFVEVASLPLRESQAKGEAYPQVAFWTSHVVWDSFDDCRPVCRISVEKSFESKNVSELPARLWIRTEPLKDLLGFPMNQVTTVENDIPIEVGGVRLKIVGRSGATGYTLTLRMRSVNQQRIIPSVPPFVAVRQEVFPDGTVAYSYSYPEKPAGEIKFFQAPDKATGNGWESTDWLELSPGDEVRR